VGLRGKGEIILCEGGRGIVLDRRGRKHEWKTVEDRGVE